MLVVNTFELSVQLDEATLPGNKALFLDSLSFIKEKNVSYELLFANV